MTNVTRCHERVNADFAFTYNRGFLLAVFDGSLDFPRQGCYQECYKLAI